MQSLLDFPLLAFDMRPWLTDMTLVLVKGTLLLAAAGMLTYALRNSAAATRYMVWCSALLGLFLLPFLAPLMPAWQVAVLPASSGAEPVARVDRIDAVDAFSGQPAQTPVPSPKPRPRAADTRSPVAPVAPVAPLTTAPSTVNAGWAPTSLASISSTQWAMLVWLFGVVLVLGRLALAHAGARLLVSRASQVDDEEWHLMAESAAHRLGVQRLVRLRMSTWTSVPMAVGVWRPVIVLPSDADTWNEERKHAVLLHELAHVKRYDCLFQLLTNIVTALYWFNPLVWIAAWQMRIERERSADDLVLVSGADASRYAETLLETARMLRRGEWSTVAAVSMARGSQLEGRLLSILDPFRRRNQNRTATWLTLLLVACIVVPLAAFQPVEAIAQATPKPPRAPRMVTPPAPMEIEIPDIEVDIPEIEVEIPEMHIDIPAFEFVMPAIQVPEFDVDIPEMVIEIPEMDIDIPEFEWDEEQSYPRTPVDSLTIDQIIRLRQYGVDAEFIQSLKGMGYTNLTYQDLVMLGRYGADLEFIAEMRGLGYDNLGLSDYASMSKYGVDLEFVRAMRDAGYTDLSSEDLVTMSKYGVNQDLIATLNRYGYDQVSIEELVSASKYGVDSELIATLDAAGYQNLSLEDLVMMSKYGVDQDLVTTLNRYGYDNITADELVSASKYGVDEDLVAGLNAAGYDNLSLDDLVAMSKYGVDQDLVEALGRYGYRDLSADDLIAASKYGVDTDLLDGLREQGYTDVSLDDIITMTKYGVDGDYLIEMKGVGLDLPLDELIRLQRYGIDSDYVREIRDAGLKDVTVEQLIDMHNHGVDGDYIKALRDNE